MNIANRLSSLPSFGPNGPSLALSRRDYRTQPGVLTPGNTPTSRPALPVRRSSGMRDEGGKGRKIFLIDGSLGKALGTAATPVLPPLQHPQPRGRGVQFGLGAVLQYSNTPSLRAAGFEDEDDDEDSLPDEALRSVVGSSVAERSRENEAPCEGGTFFDRHPGLKPRAESYYPFGICSTSPYWTVYLGPNTDANRQLPDQERQSK
jgi:hypothetical protein